MWGGEQLGPQVCVPPGEMNSGLGAGNEAPRTPKYSLAITGPHGSPETRVSSVSLSWWVPRAPPVTANRLLACALAPLTRVCLSHHRDCVPPSIRTCHPSAESTEQPPVL